MAALRLYFVDEADLEKVGLLKEQLLSKKLTD